MHAVVTGQSSRNVFNWDADVNSSCRKCCPLDITSKNDVLDIEPRSVPLLIGSLSLRSPFGDSTFTLHI